jgi:protein SCO1/2
VQYSTFPFIFNRLLAILFVVAFSTVYPVCVRAMQEHAGMEDQVPATPMSKESQHVHHEPPAEIGLEPQLGVTLPLDLTLTDEQGKPVRLGDLIDRPTLILPIYYSCPNVCNFLQAGVAAAVRDVGRTAGEDYRILSISFDDTERPEDARKARQIYTSLAGHDFPPDAWHFLTGAETTTRALFDTAGYYYLRQGEDFLHPVVSFVVSADGKIIRYLHGTRPLAKDLTLALYEAKSGRVGATIRKVVQFCFTYDPENNTYVVNLLRISATVILTCMGLFLIFLLLSGRKKKDRKS